MDLTSKKCVPCEAGSPPLSRQEAEKYLGNLGGWKVVDNRIEKDYRFPSYLKGIQFAYDLGKIAEEEGHHPDILIRWRRVKVTLTTDAIKGLSENDFIMAAKTDIEYPRF